MWAAVLRTSDAVTLAQDHNRSGFSHSPLSLRCLCLSPGQGLQGSSPKGGGSWLVPTAWPSACERGSSSCLPPTTPFITPRPPPALRSSTEAFPRLQC